MKLNLLIALAAGVGALVAPQPQLKKVQSLSFAPAHDVCDDIDAMRVDRVIEGKFHSRFYQCKKAWERRLNKKRRERDAPATSPRAHTSVTPTRSSRPTATRSTCRASSIASCAPRASLCSKSSSSLRLRSQVSSRTVGIAQENHLHPHIHQQCRKLRLRPR